MASQKKFEAAIEIGGRINRSFNNSVDRASKGFGTLERAGNKAATSIDKSFAHLGARIRGRFVGSIASSTKAMGAMAAKSCLLYTSPSPRDGLLSRMPSSA